MTPPASTVELYRIARRVDDRATIAVLGAVPSAIYLATGLPLCAAVTAAWAAVLLFGSIERVRRFRAELPEEARFLLDDRTRLVAAAAADPPRLAELARAAAAARDRTRSHPLWYLGALVLLSSPVWLWAALGR